MSGAFELAHEAGLSSDRRKHERFRLRALTYAELDQENGGIVLDASESGISVRAVVPLMDSILPRLRLKLPDAGGWLETRARVAWTRDSGKVAGLEFEELPEQAQVQVREWLSKEASAVEDDAAYSDASSGQVVDDSQPATNEARHAPKSDTGFRDPILRIRNTPSVAVKNVPEFAAELSSVGRVVVDAPATDQMTEAAQQPLTQNVFPEEARRSTFVYFLLVVLAVVSLASGWVAGSGKVGLIVQKIQKFIVAAAPNDRVSAESEPSSAPVNEIQILDSNNQRRTISLTGTFTRSVPVVPKPSAPATVTQPNIAQPEQKPGMNFQIWTLASPQRSSASRASNAIRSGAPPVVEEHSGAPMISSVVPSPIAVTNPDSLPKPKIVTGVLKRGVLIHKVEPVYPDIASQQHISGTVILQATVGADGAVREVRAVSGSKLLVQSAVEAVRQWRYTPTLLDGKPIPTQVEISLVFSQPSEKY
jgi:protein TonB